MGNSNDTHNEGKSLLDQFEEEFDAEVITFSVRKTDWTMKMLRIMPGPPLP